MLIVYFYIHTTDQTYGVIDKNILNNNKKKNSWAANQHIIIISEDHVPILE